MSTQKNTYYPVNQITPAWSRLRRGRITASIAATCCGAGLWSSPQQAWRQIVQGESLASDWYLEHGRELEPVAVARYEVETGRLCEPCGFWVSGERPWLGASPDRHVGEDGLVEVKCGQRVYSDPAVAWLIQGSVQLYCSGRAWCDIVHYRDGEIAVWRLDRSLIDLILPKLDEYHEKFVVGNRQPKRGEVKPWKIPELLARRSYARSV